MANHRSAAKATRQAAKRQLRNKSVKSAVKTQVRDAGVLVAGREAGSAEAVALAVKTLDRAAKKGILHPKNVARRKSRLVRKLNASQATQPAE